MTECPASDGEGVDGSPAERNGHYRERTESSERGWPSLAKAVDVRSTFRGVRGFKSCSSHSFRGLGTVDQQIRGLIRIGLSGPTLFPCEYAVLP